MWISRKRILLWHTARNILAIFCLLISHSSGCIVSSYNDIQSKAVSSPIVIVARVLDLDKSTSRGTVQVRSVLKQPNSDISRRDKLTVEGLRKTVETTNQPLSAQILDTSTSTYNSTSADPCLSYVSISKSKEYILFINQSVSGVKDLYRTVHKASDYTKPDKKLLKNVLCDGCATQPNAKSKRTLEVDEGALNYKIMCRVSGNPPPEVKWYKDGKELESSMRGIAIKPYRGKRGFKLVVRIKQVKAAHVGLYQCMAVNMLGSDTSKTRLTVKLKATPPPPRASDDWSSLVDEEEEEEDDGRSVSHYIPCTGRDRDYCLHGGECRVFPDGRYKHCRCVAGFAGARCEEAVVVQTIQAPIWPTAGTVTSESSLELVYVTIALATILAVLIILLLILACVCTTWRYSRMRGKKLMRDIQLSNKKNELACLLDEVDLKGKMRLGEPQSAPPVDKQTITMATQTEPEETSLQQLRRSLNLENHFPHSTSDVVLRRKSSNSSRRRPSSNPLERRPTRSRLSATSTLTEAKRPADSEFETVQERTTPTEQEHNPQQPELTSQSTNGHSTHHQAYCDSYGTEADNSLHISESSLTSADPDAQNTPTLYSKSCDIGPPDVKLQSPYHLYNGNS